MMVNRDIISQVIGLLIVDQGLYLAMYGQNHGHSGAGYVLCYRPLFLYPDHNLYSFVPPTAGARQLTGTSSLNRVTQKSSLEG